MAPVSDFLRVPPNPSLVYLLANMYWKVVGKERVQDSLGCRAPPPGIADL